MRIIKSEVDKIKFSDKDVFYWDDDLKGFGIKSTAKSKTYIIQGRVNNKSVRRKIGNVGTLTPDEARKEAIKTLAELAKGVNVNAEKKKDKLKGVTLMQAYNDYKSIKRLRDTTLEGYDCALNKAFKDWQDIELAKINRDMIEKRFKDLSKTTPVAANLYFRALRAIFNFAIEKYLIDGEPIVPSNPCNRLNIFKMWNEVKPRKNYIKPAQIKTFFHGLTLNADDTEHYKAVKNQCMLILFTGVREQEAACLKRRNIDFDSKTMTFENTKNHRDHILPFGDWLGDFLADLCKDKKLNDYIFASNNKCGHLKDHRKTIKKIAEECKIDFCLHDLRRTFASIVENDLPFDASEYLQNRLLNHTQKDVHGKHYVQIEERKVEKAMQAVEDYILTQAGVREPEKADNVVDINNIRKNA
ncbi:MAG: tyrosine-type recombinase/integrase [Alphaproteobacteria bacterium]|nr:tyrosine-type recombinase/integrase [Alphaproteobacteria bacterium]